MGEASNLGDVKVAKLGSANLTPLRANMALVDRAHDLLAIQEARCTKADGAAHAKKRGLKGLWGEVDLDTGEVLVTVLARAWALASANAGIAPADLQHRAQAVIWRVGGTRVMISNVHP